MYVSIEVANAARAGVQYGSQQQPTAAIMTNVVTVAENEAPDISTSCGSGKNACWVSGYPKAQYGCECSTNSTASGGTLNSLNCTCPSGHVVDFVLVTTQATYTPLFNFRGQFSPITLNSQAKMRFGLN